MVPRIVLLFVSQSSARYRGGSNIPTSHYMRHANPPFDFTFPRRTHPQLLFVDTLGHYLYKNKIVQNAGYKNVRDGMYWRQNMQSWGGQLTSFSSRTAGLRIISGKDAGIDNGIGLGKMCPPAKIQNLHDTIVVFNYPGGTGAEGKCTYTAAYLNLYRSRVSRFLMKLSSTDALVGYLEGCTWTEPAFYWKMKKIKAQMPQITLDTELGLIRLINRGRPFEVVVKRGKLRPGVEFADNYVSSSIYFYMFVALAFVLPLCLLNAYRALEQIPYHFPGLRKDGPKQKKKSSLTIQQIVCPMELWPNIAQCLMITTNGYLPTHKTACPLGSWFSSYPFFNYMWKSWATTTTLFMTFNWQNEADATKKMRPTTPVFVSKRNPIIGSSCFCIFLDVYYTRANMFQIGTERGMPGTIIIAAVVLPLIGFICACYFQFEAGKVARLLSVAFEGNEALKAFRTKMIKNLAYGGIWDSIGFFAVLWAGVRSSTYTSPNFKAFNMFRLLFRIAVSFYQLKSIDKKPKGDRATKEVSSSISSDFCSVSHREHQLGSMNTTALVENKRLQDIDNKRHQDIENKRRQDIDNKQRHEAQAALVEQRGPQ